MCTYIRDQKSIFQGEYEKSVQYFGQCYELCTQLNDTAALHGARVQYGIARGHQLFQGYSSDIIESSGGADSLQQLIAWKGDRVTATDKEEGTDPEGLPDQGTVSAEDT